MAIENGSVDEVLEQLDCALRRLESERTDRAHDDVMSAFGEIERVANGMVDEQ